MAERSGSGHSLWMGLVLVLCAGGLLVGLALWSLDPSGLKPRLIAAARRATGRTLTIGGAVGVRFSFVPTIWLEDVTLSNPPGSTFPDMVKVARVELSFSLAPLLQHRLRVNRIALERPVFQLETDKAGHPDWMFPREAPLAAGPPAASPSDTGPSGTGAPRESAPRESARHEAATGDGGSPDAGGPGFTISIRRISVTDGRVSWIDDRTGRRLDAEVPGLVVTTPLAELMQATGTVTSGGRTFALTARTSPPRAVGAIGEDAMWPVVMKLVSGDASLDVDGRVALPLAGRDFHFTLDGAVPNPAEFAAWLPGLPLAALHDVTAHAEISDQDGAKAAPVISSLAVKIGSLDVRGLQRLSPLQDVTLTARGQEPIQVAARVPMVSTGAGVTGTIGDLSWLSGGASGPLAVNLELNDASARLAVRGTIQAPRRFAGYVLDLSADIPDPSLVMPAAPPGLKSVAFRMALTDGAGPGSAGPGSAGPGIAGQGTAGQGTAGPGTAGPGTTGPVTAGPGTFQFNSNAGDLSGVLSITRNPRLSIEGTLSSQHLDLDLLRQPPIAPTEATPPAEPAGPSSTSSVTPPPGPPSGAAAMPGRTPGRAVPVEPAERERPPPLLSEQPLKLNRVRAADANLKFAFQHVRLGGTDIGMVAGALTMRDGVLRLDPFSVGTPDQHQSAVLIVDASASLPLVHLTVNAPDLEFPPLLAAFGLPPVATGVAEIHADLTGQGNSRRDLAATLSGWAGIAVQGGQLDSRLINGWMGKLRPSHANDAEVTDLVCFAARAEAKAGIVTVEPSALDTAALIVEGSGEVDLTNETMNLDLRPRTTIGKTGIALPVRASGAMRAPSFKVDISPRSGGGGALAGLLLGGGKDVMGAAGGGDPCPAALARAREGAPSASTPPASTLPGPRGKR